MTEILYGLIAGGIAGIAWLLPMPKVLMALQHAYIGTPKEGKMEPFLRRVYKVLPDSRKQNLIIAWILLPIGAFFWIGIELGSGEFMAGACIVYLLWLVILTFSRKMGGTNSGGTAEKMTASAMRRLGERAGPGEFIQVIEEVGHKLSYQSLESALDILIRLGSPEARKVMVKVLNRYPDVFSKEKAEYLTKIDLLMSEKQALSTKKMPVFLEEYAWLGNEIRAKAGAEKDELLEKKAEIKGIIDEIVSSQTNLRNLYPDLFCVKCNAAAAMSGKGWKKYVHCIRCHDVLDLQGGIKHVVGKIGPFPERTLENGELCINLWNPAAQKATYVEFDDLIIAEGVNIDYNWAVSAMMQEMEQYFSEYAYAFGVEIVGKPDLDENSIKMLREIGYKD